ncbi:MAG TPA: hypothetical protein PKU69_02170 [Bacillota bacterium]|nr:hypothetical protein [Bacillota bacterium]
MEIFMKSLGVLISLAFIYIGVRFAFFPTSSIQTLQRIKYKQTGPVGKRERIFSYVFGAIFALIGLYYLALSILAFIYPT